MKIMEWFKSLFKKNNTLTDRWGCDGCGMISTNYGITNHQKKSGHTGRTRLTT